MKIATISLRSILFLLVLLGGLSCKKDESEILPDGTSGGGGGGVGGNPWGGSSITLTISGMVDDEFGKPVFGAIVRVGSITTTTDSNGIFILKDAPAKSSLGYVKVEKPGYFPGSRSFLPVEGGANVRIRLLLKNLAGTINATSGGSVSIPSGAELLLEPGSISRNGQPYTGNVNVYLQQLDPTVSDIGSRMPGDLIAVNENSTAVLKSFGMLAAELQDESGQLLQIKSGKKAQLKFPVSNVLAADAPDSIDLWHFDETNGYWLKDGSAVKENGFYKGNVSHFSYWNCDAPFPLVSMKGRVLVNGRPPSNAIVSISNSETGASNGYCNSEGRFGGFVPKGKKLTLQVFVPCENENSEVFTKEIGPFGSDFNLNDIILNLSIGILVNVKISGCYDNKVKDGYFTVNGIPYFVNASGSYSAPFCSGQLTFTAYGGNPWRKGSSETIELSDTPQNVNLKICSYVSSPGDVTDIDGNLYTTISVSSPDLGKIEFTQQNLKVSRYRNGDPIPTGFNDSQWRKLQVGGYSIYDNFPFNNVYFGKLYNWYAVVDTRGLCPAGWHVPSIEEWKKLEDILGGNEVAGGKMKSNEPAPDGSQLWNYPNSGATDASGFSGLPGGFRNHQISTDSSCLLKGDVGYWWSTNSIDGNLARFFELNTYSIASERKFFDKKNGNSVRCFKD